MPDQEAHPYQSQAMVIDGKAKMMLRSRQNGGGD